MRHSRGRRKCARGSGCAGRRRARRAARCTCGGSCRCWCVVGGGVRGEGQQRSVRRYARGGPGAGRCGGGGMQGPCSVPGVVGDTLYRVAVPSFHHQPLVTRPAPSLPPTPTPHLITPAALLLHPLGLLPFPVPLRPPGPRPRPLCAPPPRHGRPAGADRAAGVAGAGAPRGGRRRGLAAGVAGCVVPVLSGPGGGRLAGPRLVAARDGAVCCFTELALGQPGAMALRWGGWHGVTICSLMNCD